MDKQPKRPRDVNKRAASTVAMATCEAEANSVDVVIEIPAESTPEERHLAAVTLGRKGGQARAKKLTLEQKSEIAKKASKARWHKQS
jgi:hypothetical protein